MPARSRTPGRPRTRSPDPPPRIAVVLIEDNRLLREGLAARIRAEPGFAVLGAAADVDEAMRSLRNAEPDVVLIDLGLPSHDTLELSSAVRAEVPSARVIVMGLLAPDGDIANYVRAGVSGFVMKDASADQLFATIRAVVADERVLPAELTNSLFAQVARPTRRRAPASVRRALRLTAREREVIRLLGEGLSNKAIGSRLHIAVHTVKSHVHNILEKLALRSRLEIAAFSHDLNEAPPPRD